MKREQEESVSVVEKKVQQTETTEQKLKKEKTYLDSLNPVLSTFFCNDRSLW